MLLPQQLDKLLSLKTSDCSHLVRACDFYSLIRCKGYFNIRKIDDEPELVIDKARYLQRYITVCFLTNRLKLVAQLIEEFSQLLDCYQIYNSLAQSKFSLFLRQIKTFKEADGVVIVLSGLDHSEGPGLQLPVSQRLNFTNIPQPLEVPAGKLHLAESIIVGNSRQQAKIGHMTMDMHRLVQILECEPDCYRREEVYMQHQQQASEGWPQASPNLFELQTSGSTNGPRWDVSGGPHKQLLFEPTTSELLLFLAHAFESLPENGVLLLYLSANEASGTITSNCDDPMNNNNNTIKHQPQYPAVYTSKLWAQIDDIESGEQASLAGHSFGGPHSSPASSKSRWRQRSDSLHPNDLFAFTRKPLVLIVDSNNSYAFERIQNHFSAPLLVLMSPTEFNCEPLNDTSNGSLFTLFLHCPISGLCSISEIIALPESIWCLAQSYMDKFYTTLGALILQSPSLDKTYISFCNDHYIRRIIFRFIFLSSVMHFHRKFRSCSYYPRSNPRIPDRDIIQHPVLKKLILDLSHVLGIGTLFD